MPKERPETESTAPTSRNQKVLLALVNNWLAHGELLFVGVNPHAPSYSPVD